jgi:hypothetical protein
MGLFNTSCKETSQLVTQSWGRPLSLKDRLAMRIHLFVCDNCARFARQMHLIREWMRNDEGSGELSERARARITTKLQEEVKEPREP